MNNIGYVYLITSPKCLTAYGFKWKYIYDNLEKKEESKVGIE